MSARKTPKLNGLGATASAASAARTARAGRAGKTRAKRNGWSKEDLEKHHKTVAMLAAVKKKDFKKVEELIGQGADIEGKGKGGATALMMAAYQGNLDAVNRLIELGADFNAEDNAGYTVLMYAIGGDHLDVVKELIDKGAYINDDKYNLALADFGMDPSREVRSRDCEIPEKVQDENMAELEKWL